MNKTNALEIAKDFINETINKNSSQLNLSEPFDFFASDQILEDDPKLEIFKSELNKIGFTAEPTNKPNWWIISKIK